MQQQLAQAADQVFSDDHRLWRVMLTEAKHCAARAIAEHGHRQAQFVLGLLGGVVRRHHDAFSADRDPVYRLGPAEPTEEVVEIGVRGELVLLDSRPGALVGGTGELGGQGGLALQELEGLCDRKEPGWLVPTVGGDMDIEVTRGAFEGRRNHAVIVACGPMMRGGTRSTVSVMG